MWRAGDSGSRHSECDPTDRDAAGRDRILEGSDPGKRATAMVESTGNGVYVDGDEREDVVKYRSEESVPPWKDVER